MELNDALGQFRAISDTTHKFWGYFQAVAAGTTAFAWSGDTPRTTAVLILLTTAFVIFAVPNGRLVISSQAEAVAAADAIRAYARNHSAQVPAEFLSLVDKLCPDPVCWVGLCHAGLSVAVGIAIWIRGCLGA